MKAPQVKLIANRILITQDSPANITESGILLLNKEEPPSTKGTVVVVGPGMKDYQMQTKVGDHVLYGKDSGIEIILDDGNTYLIMRETEITMILSSLPTKKTS